jgi:hypothetical protein
MLLAGIHCKCRIARPGVRRLTLRRPSGRAIPVGLLAKGKGPAEVGGLKKILDRIFLSVNLKGNIDEEEMKPITQHTNLKRCSWWWRANPTG